MAPPNREVRQGSPRWGVIGLERDVTLGIEKCQVTLEKDCQSTYHFLPLTQAERHNNSNSNNCLCFRGFFTENYSKPFRCTASWIFKTAHEKSLCIIRVLQVKEAQAPHA